MGKFFGVYTQKILTHSGFRRKFKTNLDPVLVVQSWVSGTKCGPVAKLWGVRFNKYGHNFQNIGSKRNQRLQVNTINPSMLCSVWPSITHIYVFWYVIMWYIRFFKALTATLLLILISSRVLSYPPIITKSRKRNWQIESSLVQYSLGSSSEKKRDYVGKIPKWQIPPPHFGKPLLSKKKVGFIFHFRNSRTFLVFTKKSQF